MTCNLRTVNSFLRTSKRFTDSANCMERTNWQAVKPLNPFNNIRARQGNILSVDNEMQFTDCKLCLTDRQKPIRTVGTVRTVWSINGPLQCGYIGQPSKHTRTNGQKCGDQTNGFCRWHDLFSKRHKNVYSRLCTLKDFHCILVSELMMIKQKFLLWAHIN